MITGIVNADFEAIISVHTKSLDRRVSTPQSPTYFPI